jgi:hypothetical protein
MDNVSLPPGVTFPPNLPANYTIPPGFEITNQTDNSDLSNIFFPGANDNGMASTGAEDVDIPAVTAEPVFFNQPMFPYNKVRSIRSFC